MDSPVEEEKFFRSLSLEECHTVHFEWTEVVHNLQINHPPRMK